MFIKLCKPSSKGIEYKEASFSFVCFLAATSGSLSVPETDRCFFPCILFSLSLRGINEFSKPTPISLLH